MKTIGSSVDFPDSREVLALRTLAHLRDNIFPGSTSGGHYFGSFLGMGVDVMFEIPTHNHRLKRLLHVSRTSVSCLVMGKDH